MLRKTTFQNLAFFHDLHARKLLDLDPPYQRRSIWSQRFKDFFIDTILNNYPCPAIFLYEEISPSGTAKYNVVDGKQRLLTCFEFASNEFPVYEQSTVASLRGKWFRELSDSQKLDFWRYQFAVEFVPQEDERLITEIFDRINRNVARLTRQELRHAKYEGLFIQEVEAAAEKMAEILPPNFPVMAQQSRKQMKDLELVGNLLLLFEQGPRSYSQDQLDEAYSNREENWPEQNDVAKDFTAVLISISDYLKHDADGFLVRSRLRNQADFYSLAGAVHMAMKKGRKLDPAIVTSRLKDFIRIVDSQELRANFGPADSYFAAARSASNDQGPRQTRVQMMYGVMSGELDVPKL
ncbi:DUF262 domain-containing protein [Bradyrhizobium sp. CCBAU 21360]|uniref:DUF262 domain-containing protein n=1 Tax=Bradyrhizobium sp. CCBAU 21360 TaxID=1325081 RepID=UPI0023051C02|nr:DUF262 domain-containing protein [Bradyrhizobium sp. CCBAU 21360]MDA9452317.1 hypothetical protein [Bradyrhizobium sp. CCBAU 21360]